ncbi:MAG: protease modulator HflC [Verrucomicrobia bacterium]|nr:protease modulator HflC [Verrucomicrobiota bacterium]
MKSILAAIAIFAVLIVLKGTLYTVGEQEQVIITRFGQPVGQPVTDAGLHFKTPFIEDVNTFEKRIVQWDGLSSEMTTKDKLFIVVDSFGRWRVNNALAYFQKLRDERTAQSRLDTILGSEVRNIVAKHNLIEVVRTNRARKSTQDDSIVTAKIGDLPPIQFGREVLEQEILKAAQKALAEQEIGIELLDFRFKRINYKSTVLEKIYARMMSERDQIASRFLSEGAGKAAEKNGERERELRRIESDAYKRVQEIQGKADAEATQIYAQAYNTSPVAADFYQFVKTLETYKATLGRDTTLILTTDSDLFKYVKKIDGGATKAPVAKP